MQIDASSAAYERADDTATAFAARLEATVGPKFLGLYLIGSYALRDLQPSSDIDFLAVIDGGLAPANAEQVRAVHAWMASTYPNSTFDGFYVDAAALRRHPDPSSKSGWHFLEGGLSENTEIRLIEWEMLRRCGHVVSGAPVAELRVFDASDDVAPFSRRNLLEYWRPWMQRTAPYLMSDGAAASAPDQVAWAAAWCALGVPRVYVAISDDEIVSKTEAAKRARSYFGAEWHPAIDAVLAYRNGLDDTALDRLVALRAEAQRFAQKVLDAALDFP